jgi:hypothetical protein
MESDVDVLEDDVEVVEVLLRRLVLGCTENADTETVAVQQAKRLVARENFILTGLVLV